jgi:DNA-binding MarR family transcriptional regulator
MAISLESATRLNIELVRVMKLFASMRQRGPKVHPGVEPASYPVLFNLVAGPLRVSLLAEHVYSDTSTVSRQVSTLVSHGLLEKVPDPHDGRACMVSLSTEGAELVERLKASRGQWFRHLLQDWEPADAEAFGEYLERFATSVEASKLTPYEVPATASEGHAIPSGAPLSASARVSV